MITNPENPTAGGIITEIIGIIFEDSDYKLMPLAMPWKRMASEIRSRRNWVSFGFPGGFDPDMSVEFSKNPVLQFNHIAITLRSNDIKIESIEDVFGHTVILIENFHYPGLDPYLDSPIVGTGNGQINTVRSFSPLEALRMLQHQRGTIVFGYQARMLYNFSAAGLKQEDVRIQSASSIIPDRPLYISYSPYVVDEVKVLIDDRLEQISNDGRLAIIIDKYFGSKLDND
ncbi:MAG: hypothetical protein GKR90_27845 [Pseudomonadales bacterium]|nr:hypothetical protein [Pseudomonadales bacterium]